MSLLKSEYSSKIIKWTNSKYFFIFILLLFSLIYNYPTKLFENVGGVHNWRQTDCLSLTLNYAQCGMNFLEPRTHNLTSFGNTTNHAASSEVPFLYYLVALLYKIFGLHEFFLRGIVLLCYFLGLYYLYKCFLLLKLNYFYSSTISLFFFCSPVLVYYGNNFLTDVPGLSFAIIGLYYFLRFTETSKTRDLALFSIAFLIAGSLKITDLTLFFALFGVLFLSRFVPMTLGEKRPKVSLLNLILIPTILIPIIAWTYYAKKYNAHFSSGYFSTNIQPIWNLSSEEIKGVTDAVRHTWKNHYFHWSFLIVCLLTILYNFFVGWKRARLFYWINLFLLGGTILYVLLWFKQFWSHDYYAINIYILFIFNLLLFVYNILKVRPIVFEHKYIKLATIIFLLFNCYHTRKILNVREHSWMNGTKDLKSYYSIKNYLPQLGIHPKDTVIALPDKSHTILYLMNLYGTTACMDYNQTVDKIFNSINKGANYLFISGEEEKAKGYLRPFQKHKMGDYEDISIYDLRPFKSLQDMDTLGSFQIYNRWKCDADKITADKNYFVVDSSYFLMSNASQQTTEKSYSGKYSLKLDQNGLYGFTSKIKGVQAGEIYRVKFMVFTDQQNPCLVANFNDVNLFYDAFQDKDHVTPGKWNEIVHNFYIDKNSPDSILSIYLWNKDNAVIYCDDFEIIRYR